MLVSVGSYWSDFQGHSVWGHLCSLHSRRSILGFGEKDFHFFLTQSPLLDQILLNRSLNVDVMFPPLWWVSFSPLSVPASRPCAAFW